MSVELVLEEPSDYKSISPPNYDAAWKNIIEKLFKEFVQFFAPELYTQISFAEEPEFLKQELHKIIIKNLEGTNYSDQIVKVSLKNGTEKWDLIHVEVQDEVTKDFSKRMFRYFYRIFDKFDHEIYAIALIRVKPTRPTRIIITILSKKLTLLMNMMYINFVITR
ncbi:hypothetical protein [Virgibacillus kimchii]